MKRTRTLIVVVIGVMLILGLAARQALMRQEAVPRPAPSTAHPAPSVGIGHARYATVPVVLQLTASIDALNEAVILPKTAGYLQQVAVRVGDAVRAGQMLAVVDHSQLDAQVNQAQAALTAAEIGVQTSQAAAANAHAQYLNALAVRQSATAQLANAHAVLGKVQATLADAQATHQRMVRLVQEGALAQQALDDQQAQLAAAEGDVHAAEAQVRVALAQIAQGTAQVAAAKQQEAVTASQVRASEAQVAGQRAAVELITLDRRDATIVAPFAGMVVSRTLDPGAYVTPGTSTPILTIANLDTLDVIVNVAQTDLATVRPGEPARIQVNTYPGRTFAGTVSRVAAGVDPATRTVQVEIDIPNPDHALRPGMYATVEIEAGSHRALLVPLSALVTVGTQHFVWIVVDEIATQREITIGESTQNAVEVTTGLTPEDVIVVRGTTLVSEGQAVTPAPVGP
jgi:RND family efflux transporter MFP subunit